MVTHLAVTPSQGRLTKKAADWMGQAAAFFSVRFSRIASPSAILQAGQGKVKPFLRPVYAPPLKAGCRRSMDLPNSQQCALQGISRSPDTTRGPIGSQGTVRLDSRVLR